MITICLSFLALMGTGTLSPATLSLIAEIDSMVESYLNPHLAPARYFLGTLPPVQGPGIRTWDIRLYEETEYELAEDDMLMWQRHFRMECSYSHSDFDITTSFFFDLDENPVLCISKWWLNNGETPLSMLSQGRTSDLTLLLFVDKFYFSKNAVLAYSFDGAPLAIPSENELELGLNRLEYAQYILDNIVTSSPGSPPVFQEQIEYIYDNF